MATFAGQFGPEGIEYPDGGHGGNVEISVFQSDGITLAILYSDRLRTANVDNPVATDEYGNLTFWTEPGFYQLGVGGAKIPVVVALDPFEPTVTEDPSNGFTFVQSSPAATWTVYSSMGRAPRSIMMIVDGEVVDSDYNVSDDYTVITVTNPYPIAGSLQIA